MFLGVDFIDFFIVDRDTSIWKKLMYFGEFLNGGFSKIIQIVPYLELTLKCFQTHGHTRDDFLRS